jgi:HEAT repeat protein
MIREYWVPQAAAEALALLAGHGEVLTRLRPLLRSPEEQPRRQTADLPGRVPPTSAALPEVGRLLRQLASDPHPLVRAAAAEALGKLGPAAADAAPELARLADDPDEWVRRRAADALPKLSGG